MTGLQLGSEPEVQVPNHVSNHLTSGLLNYIHTTGRYTSGINLFEKLRTRDLEVSSLLARVLISADEEVQAVQLLHDAVSKLPMDYCLLDCQSTFCQKKGRLDWALECAKRGVTAAPSEFSTWAKLAEVYVGMEQWDLALLTLNSCPMFTYQDKDLPRMPEPSRIILPVLPETMLDEIDESPDAMDGEQVHPSLRKLHAAGYKGTFLKAYSLLTEITAKIGWDQLLKIRSQVFVMEEEYRSEKQTSGQQSAANPNASTTALRGTPSPRPNGEKGTPQINGMTHQLDRIADDNDGDEKEENRSPPDSATFANRSIEKPEHTITSAEVKSGSNDDPSTPISTQPYTHFHNKRLCERWLDNLFMVLYEDLRIYTIWRTDMARAQQDASDYHKSPEEWDILGELAERLHHFPEAVEAYQSCLRMRFSPKAMKGVLRMYEERGKSGEVLQAMIRLIAWQYRWYSEVSFFFSPSLFFSFFGSWMFRTRRETLGNKGDNFVANVIWVGSETVFASFASDDKEVDRD